MKAAVEAEFPEKGEIPIRVTSSDDIRSYHINSERITSEIGFRPKRGIEQAVSDLCQAFRAGLLPDSMSDNIYFNVKRMQDLWTS